MSYVCMHPNAEAFEYIAHQKVNVYEYATMWNIYFLINSIISIYFRFIIRQLGPITVYALWHETFQIDVWRDQPKNGSSDEEYYRKA